jgi:outer membrane protein insertion porin family
MLRRVPAALLLLLSLTAAAQPSTKLAVVKGRLIDPEEKLIDALGLERGCPKGLTGEMKQRAKGFLDALGYKLVRLECRPPRALVEVKPHRVIRKIYIKGNWPLFEEEILRRLRFRPGQRLPEGKALAAAIARQEERMRDFLSREGYFDGSLRIKITPTRVAHQVNVEVQVSKGRRFKVGEVVAEPVRRGRRRQARERAQQAAAGQGRPNKSELAIPPDRITSFFRHCLMLQRAERCLFYRRSFNTKRFNEDVEYLIGEYHKLGYPGVRVRKSFEVLRDKPPDDAVRIELKIQERKRIELEFLGNDSIKDRDLRAELTIFDEGAYDDYELAQSARRIHRLYQSKGHLQARVTFSRKVGEKADRVTFEINEGPRFRIEEVQFRGNRAVSTEKLRKVIKTKPFPFLGSIGLGEGGYITATQLKQDVERLEAHYNQLGFPDVKVTGQIAPHPALMDRPGALAAVVGAGAATSGELYVRFTIREGKRAIVEKVYIDGNKLISSDVLLAQLTLKPGRPFAGKRLELDKARLARIYGEKGYPYAEVRALEELSLDGTRVSVQFSVVERKRVRFGPVFVRGNFKTRRSVIESDIDFKPGEPFDIRKIELAERKLRKRQLFNMVRLQLLGIGEKQQEVPVLVSVEERHDDRGAIEFGVGGSTDNLLFGSLAYTNQNVLGFGTSISLKGEVGMKIQSGDLHYRDPRLLGSELKLDVQGFVRNQITERLGEVLTFGGTIALSYEFLPRLTGLMRYEIRQVKHKEDIHRPAAVDESRQVDVFTRTGGIGPALIYDTRDNPLSPTKGYRVEGSMLWASQYLGGTQHFIKFNLSGQLFVPLPKGITVAFGGRYDHGLPLGGDVQLPKVERYFAGGDTTIRGLEEDMAWAELTLAPLAPLAGASYYFVRPQGGNIRLLTNLEIQFPIWRESILFGLPLMGAVFMDNGMVTNSFFGFEASDFRHGAGLALRIVTPVGFSSFEYAWALDPELWDPRFGRFHFNFGFVF